MATAHPGPRFHDGIAFAAPARPEAGTEEMPGWARRLAASVCLIHGATIVTGLAFGGLYLALGVFGAAMLVVGVALLYRYHGPSGGPVDPAPDQV